MAKPNTSGQNQIRYSKMFLIIRNAYFNLERLRHSSRLDRLWNGFDSDAKLFMYMYSADIEEFWNFQFQTFYHFSKLYLSFPDFTQVWKIAWQISRLFQEFKTRSAQTLCDTLFAMSFCFCLEVFHFAASFCSCFEVFGFAGRVLLLSWKEVFVFAVIVVATVDKGVCSHRLPHSKLKYRNIISALIY